MKQILLKSLSLAYFKGIREMHLDFTQNTEINGENGTGKTTVFDSFCWLLFGKDSSNRSDSNFNIKTLDASGDPIHKVDHTVTGVLLVDGKEVKLQRTYREVWVKPRMTNQETLKNHETEFLINDVKCPTKKEYDAFVSSIIPENVFKMITNPFCFPTLSADKQKDMLLQMAGDVSDDEIAVMKPEFSKLLAQMAGVPMERFLKEIAAKKKAIKDQIAVIPSQISTANSLKPEAENWDELDKAIAEKRAEITKLDKQLQDRTSVSDESYQAKQKLVDELNAKRAELSQLQNKIREDANSKYYADKAEADKNYHQSQSQYSTKISEKKNEIYTRETEIKAEAGTSVKDHDQKAASKKAEIESKRAQVNSLQTTLNTLNSAHRNISGYIDSHNARIQKLDVELTTLRSQYGVIAQSQLTTNPNDFVCPTCGRPLETEDVESKLKEMRANFNADKSANIKANQEDGKKARCERDQLLAELDGYNSQLIENEANQEDTRKDLERATNELKVLSDDLDKINQERPTEPDYTKLLAADPKLQQLNKELGTLVQTFNSITKADIQAPDFSALEAADQNSIDLKNKITDLQNQVNNFQVATVADTSDIDLKKEALNTEIDSLVARKAKKAQIERADKEIQDLQKKEDEANAKLADMEGEEFTAMEFQKTKDAELLKRINGMFQLVSFSFISSQLNGGEKLTCICTVNGTPYPDVNNAGKINAGLDIINAICKIQDVCAPIFIDNAESINNILPTVSQRISMYVTKDQSLIIK